MQASRRHRRRLPRSCEECRRRKVKCDRNNPCSQCVLTKCRCLYNVGPRLSPVNPGRPGRAVSSLNNYFPSLQAVANGSESSVLSRQRLGSDPFSSVPGQAMTEGCPASFARGSEITNLEGEPLSPEPLSFHNRLASGPKIISAPISQATSCPKQNNTAILDRPLVLNKSRLFGQTHWTNAVYEFKRIAAFMKSDTTNSAGQVTNPQSNTTVRTLLKQCKQLSQNVKTLRPGRFLSCPEPIVSSPDTADHLVYLYESNMESAFRILHRPSFRKEYERYKAASIDVADVTMLKIQLVIAIGSGICPEIADANEVRRAACQWLYAAQEWLSGPMEKNRLNMDGIQVHCLLILARQILSVGGDLSWVAMGVLVRTAVQLGLHRDPKHFPQISVFEAEMRRRIWATVLELNAQASLDSGTPPGISLDDFDTSPPANLNDEDMEEGSTSLGQRSDTVQTDTSLQRCLLQNLPPRLEMLRRMNGLGMKPEDEHTLMLSAKLSAACREVDAQIRTDPNPQTASFKRNMASLLLRRFLLVLHRPLAGRIRENALYYHSRKLSFDSAMALLKPPSPNDAFSYIMLRGGGLFKSCTNHASLAVASELLIEIEEQGSSTYRQMLVDAVREARRQWVQRLKLGDTNFRLHMKLSIVLSQAEDVGEDGGQTQQQRMAQSARDSLELCYLLIKESLESGPNIMSSKSDDWSGRSPHPARSTEQSNLARDPFGFGDILQMNESDMDGIFDSNILLL
ncbi:fungal-specific transcription factor domain-containing protein [Xylaria castorea]|nr:fungal-specific transcription factor domain-containing protein [Xylaria castorea]